ncbi:MAG: hypothetical protein Kow00124_06970 [Anaerolineae bacterium]
MLARLQSISKWGWIGAAAAAVAAISILLFLGLTGRLAAGYTRLDPLNPTTSHPDGLTVMVLPGSDTMRVRLSATSREAFLADQAGREWAAAHAALPATLTPLSPLYSIRVRGAGSLQAEVAIPADAEPLRLVDLYHWDQAQDRWAFLPYRIDEARQAIVFQTSAPLEGVMAARLEPDPPGAGVIVSPGGPDLGPNYGLAVAEGLAIDSSGQISGTPAEVSGSTVLLMVRNHQGGFTAYEDAALRTPLITQLSALAAEYDGLVLDFAGGPGYTDFIAELAGRLHEQGKRLDITLDGSTMAGNYDPAALGQHVDRIWVAPGDNPTAYLPGSTVQEILDSLVGLVHRQRIGLLVSVLHVEVSGGSARPITLDEALAVFGSPEIVQGYADANLVAVGSDVPVRLSGQVEAMGFDSALGMNYILTRDEMGQPRYVYLTSPQGVSRKLAWARDYGLSAVLLYGLAHPDTPQNIADGLSAFLNEQQVAAPTGLEIVWRVDSPAGGSVAEESGDLNLIQYLWHAAVEPGEYLIRALIRGQSQENERGSLRVAVVNDSAGDVAPTPTPSAPPPAQQTPASGDLTPQPTSTPAPPVGQVAAGAFELGGQTHSLSHPDWMRRAGMTWVKFQVKWSPGDDPAASVGWRIQTARQNGFKVLLAIPGQVNPASIDFPAYIEFLRGVAALGPDAIEIWNEQNLSVEWPLADISGASYVNNMLAPAYQAIKAVNPGILVIGGAPAPSGYWGPTGCGTLPGGGGGCSDLGYIQQMRDAGAASYMDCMGVHYNEGIISPTQTSGDPRDDYYTRYFWGMVNTYYGTFGKPLCLTELGYLSPEGYGALPANFAWAGDTSVAEQAQWLAEAAVLASQSGKVRLMIVWNVDIFTYGNDPQGGYAIVRPDGGCPACEALQAVMP